jgi:hypothetical protein
VARPYPASCLIKCGDALFVAIVLVAAIALTSVPEPERVLKTVDEFVRF